MSGEVALTIVALVLCCAAPLLLLFLGGQDEE